MWWAGPGQVGAAAPGASDASCGWATLRPAAGTRLRRPLPSNHRTTALRPRVAGGPSPPGPYCRGRGTRRPEGARRSSAGPSRSRPGPLARPALSPDTRGTRQFRADSGLPGGADVRPHPRSRAVGLKAPVRSWHSSRNKRGRLEREPQANDKVRPRHLFVPLS